MEYLRGIFGVLFLIFIAYLFTLKKRQIDWRLVFFGVGLQIIIGILVIKVELVANIFSLISENFVTLLNFSKQGASFLFGDFVDTSKYGFVFVLQVLPTVIFFSSLSSGFFHLGLIQFVVKRLAKIMILTLKLSGAEALSVVGNIFLGQSEAPLLVKPFIPNMTKSELMCLMTGGMATIAGGVLAGYVILLGGDDPREQAKFATYLMSASLMNAPAAIIFSKILLPDSDLNKLDKGLQISTKSEKGNLIDAFARGASEGLKVALNICAMLLAFIAIITALNYCLSTIGTLLGINDFVINTSSGQFSELSLEFVLGHIFRIFAFIIGVDWADSLIVGSLLGQKLVINEFVAYLSLTTFQASGTLLPKSVLIATYALCGFSNFSSIAIQIGSIGSLAPNQRENISSLGMRALLAASLATMMTASVAGAISSD